jgi:hypothetical protein
MRRLVQWMIGTSSQQQHPLADDEVGLSFLQDLVPAPTAPEQFPERLKV